MIQQVTAISIKAGDVLSFDECDFAVERVGFGDPMKEGFVLLNDRMAAPWIIELEAGPRLVVHPAYLLRKAPKRFLRLVK